MENSLIVDNTEYKIKIIDSKHIRERLCLPKKTKNEIIKCFINQYPKYIYRCIKKWNDEIKLTGYWKDEKNGIPRNNIYISTNYDFVDYFYFAYQKTIKGEYWDKINKNCYITLHLPYTYDDIETYCVHPEYKNIKEYLKNKIVDKYLIDDIRDLIII